MKTEFELMAYLICFGSFGGKNLSSAHVAEFDWLMELKWGTISFLSKLSNYDTQHIFSATESQKGHVVL